MDTRLTEQVGEGADPGPLTAQELELVEATGRWERAECFDCGAVFESERGADFHAADFGHAVLHWFGPALVN